MRQIGSEHSDFRRLALDRPIAALYGDRFVLRDAADSLTLAGGRVIDPFAPPRRWSNAVRLRALEAMRDDDPACALRVLSAQGPVVLRRYLLARNVTAEEGARILAAVPLEIRGRGEHEIGFALELWKHLRDSVVSCVTAHGASGAGTPLADIQRALKPNDQPEIVDHVLASLVADGTIIRIGRHVRLASARPSLGAGEMRRWRQLRGALEAAGLRPPPLVELAALTDWDAAAVERLLARAEQSGLAMRVAPNRYFLPGTLRALGEIAARLADESQDGSFTASTFKDRSGIGRNISIDLLEFFDRVRLTQRVGARRRMRSDVAAVFPDSPLECA
jgi:selenocysteine-specific elongation factor